MSLIPALKNPTSAFQIASLSVCTAKLSRVQGPQNEVLAQSSLKLYIQGLQALQRALANPKLMYKDETLGACMLLALYEVYECPAGSRKGYIMHQGGLARLIYYRGPEAHVRGFAHSLFLAFRSMEVSIPLKPSRFCCMLT
jgi:transcription factor-like protein